MDFPNRLRKVLDIGAYHLSDLSGKKHEQFINGRYLGKKITSHEFGKQQIIYLYNQAIKLAKLGQVCIWYSKYNKVYKFS